MPVFAARRNYRRLNANTLIGAAILKSDIPTYGLRYREPIITFPYKPGKSEPNSSPTEKKTLCILSTVSRLSIHVQAEAMLLHYIISLKQ